MVQPIVPIVSFICHTKSKPFGPLLLWHDCHLLRYWGTRIWWTLGTECTSILRYWRLVSEYRLMDPTDWYVPVGVDSIVIYSTGSNIYSVG